jgi:hypothetical protein
MIIQRLRIVLPARLRATADVEARVLAEALAVEMAGRDGLATKQALTLPGAGQTGAGMAHRIGLAGFSTGPAKGGRHGG